MKYTRNESVIINCEEDDNDIKYIAYNIDSSRIFIMNKSANEIFSLLSELNESDKVICSLRKKYGDLSNEQINCINKVLRSMVEKEIFYCQ